MALRMLTKQLMGLNLVFIKLADEPVSRKSSPVPRFTQGPLTVAKQLLIFSIAFFTIRRAF